MTRRHIFAAIILQALLFVTAFGTEDFTESPTDLKRVNDARKKAENYIWNVRDELGRWPIREAASAILGLAGNRASINGLESFSNINETNIIRENLDRVHLNFFLELVREDNDLEDVGDNVLSQVVSVLSF